MDEWKTSVSPRTLRLRSSVLHLISSFFHDRGFLEVETPVLLKTPALELHIDAIPAQSASRIVAREPAQMWLRTSPELHMKRLLAAGHERIFQLGPCFRRGERGDRHHPEFTMLEWYRAGADYMDILADTRELMVHVFQSLEKTDLVSSKDWKFNVAAAWRVFTVSDAFQRWAGWDPATNFDADRFDLDLVEKVEPALPRNVPVVLTDYPAAAAALSRRKAADPRLAERWELYLGGLELANAYSELTDAAEQESRFKECAEERRKLGKDVYPIDEPFLAALRSGLPACGGIAFGVDRLVMLLAGAKTLDEVMAFRE